MVISVFRTARNFCHRYRNICHCSGKEILSWWAFVCRAGKMNIDGMISVKDGVEVKELTERLHSYIKRMRELHNGSYTVKTQSFYKVCVLLMTEKTFKNIPSRLRIELVPRAYQQGVVCSHKQIIWLFSSLTYQEVWWLSYFHN